MTDLDAATPLAVGRSADVFALPDGRVLRRYRDAAASAEQEARLMRHVHALGFPVPRVHDVDGADLVMEHVLGVTMLEALRRAPWRLPAYARLLADLHQRLHALPAPPWLPESPFAGDRILHLDLHPLNVLVTPTGPVVIDWPNARRGDPFADVAHTWLVLATARPDRPVDRALSTVARAMLVRRFLAEFPTAPVAAVMPAVADRWLTDRNISDRERRATHALLRRTARAARAPG